MSSLHNALDYGPELGRAVNRVTGLGSLEEGMVRLGETLTPVINQWDLPEAAFLRGETLCAYVRLAPAVAAQQSGIALGNPAGSGQLVVVRSVSTWSTAGVHQMWMHVDAALITDLSSSSQGTRRDRRGSGTPTTSRAVVRYGAAVAIVAGSQLEDTTQAVALTVNFFRHVPVILAPGDALAVWNTTLATDTRGQFLWTERPARPGELP